MPIIFREGGGVLVRIFTREFATLSARQIFFSKFRKKLRTIENLARLYSVKTKKKVTFGISWPNEEVLESGKRRAEEMGISFSQYVNHLVRKDLGIPGIFDRPEPPARMRDRYTAAAFNEDSPADKSRPSLSSSDAATAAAVAAVKRQLRTKKAKRN